MIACVPTMDAVSNSWLNTYPRIRQPIRAKLFQRQHVQCDKEVCSVSAYSRDGSSEAVIASFEATCTRGSQCETRVPYDPLAAIERGGG